MTALRRPDDLAAPAGDGDDRNAVRQLNDMFAADADRHYRRADELEAAGRSAAAGIARRQADIYAAAVREYDRAEDTRRQ